MLNDIASGIWTGMEVAPILSTEQDGKERPNLSSFHVLNYLLTQLTPGLSSSQRDSWLSPQAKVLVTLGTTVI